MPSAAYYIIAIFSLISGVGTVHAQFQGGSDDGTDRSGTVEIRLNGVPAGVSVLYQGAADDGASKAVGFFLLNGSAMESMYGGGIDDGFVRSLGSFTLNGSAIGTLYGGGNDDGFAKNAAIFILNGTDISALYNGGSDDGFAKDFVLTTPEGTEITALYGGGPDDGFARRSTLTLPAGIDMTILYHGGIEDGSAKSIAGVMLNGIDIASLYRGGTDDGFSRWADYGIIQSPCDTGPSAQCMDITVQIDSSGSVLIEPEDIDNGSTDNCGILAMTVDTNTFDCNALGDHIVTLTVENTGNFTASCSATVTVADINAFCNNCFTQDIPIGLGWNLISSYVIPDDPNMLNVVEDISDDIIIIKNGAGQAALPSINFNQIGNWNVVQGYQVKTSTATSLAISCAQVVPETTPLSLSAGWSIMAYLRDSPMDIAIALAGIDDEDIIIVKDETGKIFIPTVPFNQIGNMKPGEGYQIKMANAASFTYPANSGRVTHSPFTPPAVPVHYRQELNTGNNATIYIPEGAIDGLEPGDEIGAFSGRNVLTGSAVLETGPVALAIWGNDPVTSDTRHMQQGEPFAFRVWRPSSQEELELSLEFESGPSFFTTNGISVVKHGTLSVITGTTPLSVVDELLVYPNPATQQLHLQLNLHEASDIQLLVSNITGALVAAPRSEHFTSGTQTISLDVSMLPAGQYFYKLSTDSQVFSGGFMVFR